MKRYYSDDIITIKEIKPLFWKRCKYCNKEFRLEKGYQIENEYINSKGSRCYSWKYCCAECSDSIENVANKYKESKEKIVYKNKIVLYY